MSFQQSSFQQNAFQIGAFQQTTSTMGNTVRAGVWTANGGNTVIGRSLAFLLSLGLVDYLHSIAGLV